MINLKIVKGPNEDLSKKDLVEVVPVLKKKLNSGSLETTIKSFQTYVQRQIYVRYKKHTTGVAHHGKLGPSRRPIKIYKHIISVLKNLRGTFSDILKVHSNYRVQRILVNSTGYKKGGIIRRSHGSAALKKIKHHRLVFYLKLKNQPTQLG